MLVQGEADENDPIFTMPLQQSSNTREGQL